jgi:hypothetical protein
MMEGVSKAKAELVSLQRDNTLLCQMKEHMAEMCLWCLVLRPQAAAALCRCALVRRLAVRAATCTLASAWDRAAAAAARA